MGMSTFVVGFRPADEKWKKMKSAWDACEAVGTKMPEEVSDFFDGTPPGDKPGAEVDIRRALCEWSDESRAGYEVDLGKLPKDVNILRFYVSW